MTISFDLNRTRYWNLSQPPNVGIFSGRQEIWESNLVIRVRDGIIHLAVILLGNILGGTRIIFLPEYHLVVCTLR